MMRDRRAVKSPSVDWDPGRAPLFYRDLRDVGFFLKDFIYLFERERDRQSARKGTQAGEWERKKQVPSGEAQ